MARTGNGAIRSYLTAITNGRGMAKSNTYAVYFTLTDELRANLRDKGRQDGLESVSNKLQPHKVGERIMLMCDEVSLPGIQINTGSVAGRFQGQGPIYYPTAPIYNDLQLSFMCDGEMQAFKFLLDWNDFIYNTTSNIGLGGGEKTRKLRYPKEYQCKLYVEKRERDATSEIGAQTMKFTLHNAWPYSVDAVPLSYGSSQLVKCTANFYYTSWDRDPNAEKGLSWPNR